jgi:hypothetical protein
MTRDELIEKVSTEYSLAESRATEIVDLLSAVTEDKLHEARTLALVEARDALSDLADDYQERYGDTQDFTRGLHKAAKTINTLLTKHVLQGEGLELTDNTEGMPR